MDNNNNKVERDPIDMLLDENCSENITLFDEENKPVEFEQIALIPLDDCLFAILRPVNDTSLAEDEALVFELTEDIDEDGDGDVSIHYVDDEDLANKVFEEYNKLFENN